MKLTYFLIWLAGGGLVALTTFVCVLLLRACVAQQTMADEQLWDMLIPPSKS